MNDKINIMEVIGCIVTVITALILLSWGVYSMLVDCAKEGTLRALKEYYKKEENNDTTSL